MKAIAVIIAFFLASPAVAFEANVIWLKGNVDIGERNKLDPTVNISGFEVGNDEPVTLYITYRAATRDDRNWSKVTFRFSMVSPKGQPEPAEEPTQWIVAGEGIVPADHMGDWAASRGRAVLAFSKEDDRDIYTVRTIVKDHVSGEMIEHTTRILLRGLAGISSQEDYLRFVDRYYQSPQPELIAQAIEFLGLSKILKKYGNVGPPALGFFARTFSGNPDSVSEWKKVIRRQDRTTRKLP